MLFPADKSHSQFLPGSREAGGGIPEEAMSLAPCPGAGISSFPGSREPALVTLGFLMPYCAVSQIYWLHMVYAALGAICFTLVSLFPLLGGELRWWTLGSLGGGVGPWTIVLFLM